MIRQIDVNGLCPCGSNKPSSQCCLRKFSPSIPGSQTGLKNEQCYASRYNDCSTGISNEHYISHSVLKELSDKGMIEVKGLPWVSEVKKIYSKALTSKILCKRHNEALSGLDDIARRLIVTIKHILNEFNESNTELKDQIFLFNGYDLEKALLKTLIGIGFSQNASSKNAVLRDWKPHPNWTDVLFKDTNIPENLGLYFPGLIGEKGKLNYKLGFTFAPVSNENHGIYAGIFRLFGLQLILVMAEPPVDKKDTILENHIYRLNELIFTNGICKKVVVFNWDTKRKGGSLTIRVERKL